VRPEQRQSACDRWGLTSPRGGLATGLFWNLQITNEMRDNKIESRKIEKTKIVGLK